MSGIKIRSMGHALPSKQMTNSDFEAIVDTSDEWIRTRTGIESRYICDPDQGENVSSLAVAAAKEALERGETAGIQKEEIGLIITASCSNERQMPTASSLVQEELQLKDGIPAFDINVACSGFVYGLQIANSMMKEMAIKYALVIGSEQLSRIVDYTDRSTCVLFGDGAAAAVISLEETIGFSSVLGASGDRTALSSVGKIEMDGRKVFRFAVGKLEDMIHTLSEQSGVSVSDIDYIVCHQANYRIIEHVRKKFSLSAEKLPMNLQRTGNTSAASIPLMLYDLQEEGALKPGTKVFCIGFGAGLTWGGVYLEF